MKETNSCECPQCAGRYEFQIEQHLFREFENLDVVLFIGAGVSTENPNSSPHSLYSEVMHRLNDPKSNAAFPDLVEQICQQPDGRFEFTKMVQRRFDYIKKFPDLYYAATRFFEELSTMPYLNTFITTNWDRSLEEICHAKPFVYDTDMRFWEVPDRRVLKIHGTIDDYSSLVASRSDYNKCAKHLQSSLIGGKLKDILNTKTCIFVGYSLKDDDFADIYNFVQNAQGLFQKTHYFVSPNDEEIVLPNITKIKTDGTFFLETVKNHMSINCCYLDDDVYDAAADELIEILDEHHDLCDRIDAREKPQVIMTTMYQDGLIHGFQLALNVKGTGHFSDFHSLQGKIQLYEAKINSYRKQRSYTDVAYFTGFQNVLIFFAASVGSNEFYSLPRYFHPKVGEMDVDEYFQIFDQLPEMHKAAFRECKNMISRFPEDEKFIAQHMAWG